MNDYTIRPMTIGDYEEVYALWTHIRGFGIRSIDDSREDIARFLERNPNTSAVAVCDDRIVGNILCGHDGRQGSFYHVCVAKNYRRHGIATKMAVFCMRALQDAGINKITLIAFSENEGGNAFWRKIGWTSRSDDVNYYEFVLNENNITKFVQGE